MKLQLVEEWSKKASARLLALGTVALAVADFAFSDIAMIREHLSPDLYKWVFLVLFLVRILRMVPKNDSEQ